MTILLAVVAGVLLIAIVAAGTTQMRQGQASDAFGSIDAGDGAGVGFAPVGVEERPLVDILAEKEAEAARARADAPDVFFPGNLGVGTAITYQGSSGVIIGVLSYDQDAQLWQDYLIEQPNGAVWRFGVEPNKSFRLAAFEAQPITAEAGEPGDPTMQYQGHTYVRTEHGRARYRAAGRHEVYESGNCEYVDYENADGVILSFERFDAGRWLTAIGHRVNPRAVTVDNDLS